MKSYINEMEMHFSLVKWHYEQFSFASTYRNDLQHFHLYFAVIRKFSTALAKFSITPQFRMMIKKILALILSLTHWLNQQFSSTVLFLPFSSLLNILCIKYSITKKKPFK